MQEGQQFTALSEQAWQGIAASGNRPADAVRFFSQRMVPRSFGDVLRAAMERQGMDERTLVGRLTDLRPGVKRDSLRRRLSAWLNGGGQPADREEAVQICFALGLSGEAADEFLRCGGEGGFHLREPREAAWRYCLSAGKSYGEAQALLTRLPNADGPFPADGEAPSVFTRTLLDQLAAVNSDEDFLRFYEKNLSGFGRLHNTAYRYFSRFFEELTRPSAPCGAEEDEAYSVEKAVELYLRLNVPLSRGTKSFSDLQKAIKRLWPNATAVKNMLSRRADVSRKTLLLLYVATEGLDDGAVEEAMGWEPDSPDEIFEEHVWNINLMLHDCGFSPLDPRVPFDWLILYSLRPGDDEDASMSDRLSQVLSLLFGGGDGREVDEGGANPC